jgi:hypothetical protein
MFNDRIICLCQQEEFAKIIARIMDTVHPWAK